ncbi:LOW QUALITY PROTEIN: hypothetical protein V2J09_008781 [Rumex salicifolius]
MENSQRAGSREFVNTLKELIRIHDPTILVLVETRLSGIQADKVCKNIGFDGMTRVEAVQFQGGIWVLWRKSVVDLNLIDTHHQAVTMKLCRSGEDAWLFSAIYESLTPATREELWNRLLNLSSSNCKPWLLMGDFNKTLSLEERTGDFEHVPSIFSNWVDNIELLDLGFSGARFIWTGGRDPQTRTCARLNRGLCTFD